MTGPLLQLGKIVISNTNKPEADGVLMNSRSPLSLPQQTLFYGFLQAT